MICPDQKMAVDSLVDPQGIVERLDSIRRELNAGDKVVAVDGAVYRVRHPAAAPVIDAEDVSSSPLDV